MSYVKEWRTYFVNGYKFHTQAWTEGKKMINRMVHVKGLTEGTPDDFYGVIQHIYELEYNTTSYPKQVVLFYCHWFDPTSRGTRVDPKYDIMEIRTDRSYNLFEPFISEHNVRQVYYVPYPETRRDKNGWCVAIKTKPRGYIESDHVQDDVPYQFEEISHANKVIEVESISGLQDLRDGVEEVDPANLLKNEEESNNLNEESNTIEQKNERELEDDFEVYNFEEN